MKLFKAARKYGARVVAGGAALAGAASSFAVDPATAGEALSSLSGTTTAYGPPLFGLAVVATGIVLGIGWIKKGRTAGK